MRGALKGHKHIIDALSLPFHSAVAELGEKRGTAF